MKEMTKRKVRKNVTARKKVRVSQQEVTSFVNLVLDFYHKYGRHDLPWRKSITAYSVLVSEIMLQQTQVTRVMPKYEKWMKVYPTLAALKKGTLTEILLLWQGLGYQRRAKSLYMIAGKVSSIPKTFESLRTLPGVGEYTASALMAFAYNIFDNPVIETNIRTAVIEHFFKRKKEVSDLMVREVLLSALNDNHVVALGARDWYYALMDYGAHLKTKHISHNKKSTTYTKQSRFKGSQRELRAKVLFAITHKRELPNDEKTTLVLEALLKEGFISEVGPSYYQVV